MWVEIKTDNRSLLDGLLLPIIRLHGTVHVSVIERGDIVKVVACCAPARTTDTVQPDQTTADPA